MKSTLRLVIPTLVCCALLVSGAARAQNSSPAAARTRVLVITGGHDFEEKQFFKLFQDNPDITFKAVQHPGAQAWFKEDSAKQYDVLVMYDMHQEISDEGKSDLLARLKEGKGLVVLHHAIANYQTWPEWNQIIGAHYYLAKTNINGVEKARSKYQHGVNIKVHVADPQHPIARGVQDYEIHDETYKLFDVADDVKPLLTTKEPLSNDVIAWSKTYAGARVVYMQSGHDHFAYENPNFQRLLRQAINWTAHKE